MAWERKVPFANQRGGSVAAKVSFYSGGDLFVVNGVSGQDPRGKKRLDGDIISITTDKDLANPTGSFTIQLYDLPISQKGKLHGRRIADVIEPNDLVIISFRRGEEDPICAMIGVVGQRPLENEYIADSGAASSTVTVTGYDLGKLLVNAGIYWFRGTPFADIQGYALREWQLVLAEEIANTNFIGPPNLDSPNLGFGNRAAFQPSKKAAVAKAVLNHFFYRVTSLSYQRQEGEFASVANLLAYRLGETEDLVPGNLTMFHQEQSVYNFLSNMAEKPWCEVFVETVLDDPDFYDGMTREVYEGTVSSVTSFDGCKSTIILRQTPFDQDDWEALPRYLIDDRHVKGASLGGEPTIYNIFYVTPTAYGGAQPVMQQALAGTGIFLKESAAKHGYRPFIAEASVMLEIKQQELAAMVKRLSERLFRWYANSDKFISGTITVQGNAIYKVGTRLVRRYQRGRFASEGSFGIQTPFGKLPIPLPSLPSFGPAEGYVREFYIEGVSHSFQAFGTFDTTLRVTRGLPSEAGNRFEDPPYSYDPDGVSKEYPFRSLG